MTLLLLVVTAIVSYHVGGYVIALRFARHMREHGVEPPRRIW